MRIPYFLVYFFSACSLPLAGMQAADSCNISGCAPFYIENSSIIQVIDAAESYELFAASALSSREVNTYTQQMANFGNAVYSALAQLAVLANSPSPGGVGDNAPTQACCLALSRDWQESVARVVNLASTYRTLYLDGQLVFPDLISASLDVFFSTLDPKSLEIVVSGIKQVASSCDCEQ